MIQGIFHFLSFQSPSFFSIFCGWIFDVILKGLCVRVKVSNMKISYKRLYLWCNYHERHQGNRSNTTHCRKLLKDYVYIYFQLCGKLTFSRKIVCDEKNYLSCHYVPKHAEWIVWILGFLVLPRNPASRFPRLWYWE